jgi:uncharacterized protein (UPF0332 family)
MAFNPQLLLVLADDLCEDPNYDDEAKYRTSISRAYYAAYLTARCELESTGIDFSKSVTVHKEVFEQLKKKNKRVSNMLFNLRLKRNDADYELGMKIQKGLALSCLKSSRHIVDNIHT